MPSRKAPEAPKPTETPMDAFTSLLKGTNSPTKTVEPSTPTHAAEQPAQQVPAGIFVTPEGRITGEGVEDAPAVSGEDSNLPTSNDDPRAIAHAIATPGNGITAPPTPTPVITPVANVKIPNAAWAKYAPAVVVFLLTVLSAAGVLPLHHTQTDIVQFGIVLAGAIVGVFAVVQGTSKWPGYIKTGALILAAILTALQPFLANGGNIAAITPTNWFVFGIAAVNAVAMELGIQYRMATNTKVEENLLV